MDNYYDILGVPQDATSEEIKKAYRNEISDCHPDLYEKLRQKAKHDPDLLELAEEKIAKMDAKARSLNEAYHILSDPNKRHKYNEDLQDEAIPSPRITLNPNSLNFGKLEKGTSSTLNFQVINAGGPVNNIHIDWDSKPSWGELTITPDPGSDFPISVDINVDTRFASPDSYQSSIKAVIDGVSYSLPVALTIIPRYVPKPVPPSPKATPSTPLPTASSSVTYTGPDDPSWTQFWLMFIIFPSIVVTSAWVLIFKPHAPKKMKQVAAVTLILWASMLLISLTIQAANQANNQKNYYQDPAPRIPTESSFSWTKQELDPHTYPCKLNYQDDCIHVLYRFTNNSKEKVYIYIKPFCNTDIINPEAVVSPGVTYVVTCSLNTVGNWRSDPIPNILEVKTDNTGSGTLIANLPAIPNP